MPHRRARRARSGASSTASPSTATGAVAEDEHPASESQVNEIEQIVTTNELGEFTFVAQPGVPYVVEIVDEAGRVVSRLSDVVVTNAGEVAGTIVVAPFRPAGARRWVQ